MELKVRHRIVIACGVALSSTGCGSWAVSDLRGFSVSPESVTLRPGQESRFGAWFDLADRTAANVTDSAAWSVDDANIVAIRMNIVEALRPGSTTLTASHSGVRAHAAITVSLSPDHGDDIPSASQTE